MVKKTLERSFGRVGKALREAQQSFGLNMDLGFAFKRILDYGWTWT